MRVHARAHARKHARTQYFCQMICLVDANRVLLGIYGGTRRYGEQDVMNRCQNAEIIFIQKKQTTPQLIFDGGTRSRQISGFQYCAGNFQAPSLSCTAIRERE